MSSPFLTVYGHVSIDQILTLKEFPRLNTSVDIVDKRQYLGGTGANIATIAARLGVPTAISSYVGGDFPSRLREIMSGSGLMMDELVTVEEEETSTALIVSDGSNDQVTYFYQGPLGSAEPGRAKVGMAKRSRHVHFSTGNPEHHIRVMEELKGRDVTIALDPAQEVHRIWDADTFRRALSHSDILFSNQHEMSSMLHYTGLKNPSELPVETTILTRGSDGADIWQDGERTHIPPVREVKVVDTTGAGDAFRAGFYAGLHRKHDIISSAMLGSVTASQVIGSVGALSGTPTWEQVLERAEEAYGL